jgi:predicted metal-binding transcription factor (methanogenesis marker protein 9)
VQVSNDPDFLKYKTIFNADHDNSAGMGIGEDMGYVETCHGRLIWCPKPQTVRYVRLYSKGNSNNDQNHYIEVEVYGRKPKGKVPTTRPARTKTPTTKPAAS